ncbi:MAG: hypothetical protein ABJC19_10300 [Gemmatimonadota bacterium]
MTRVLTVSRVGVPLARKSEYLALVHALAARLAARGQRLWVFQSREQPDRWLEFSESADAATHRAAGPADAEEARLESALAVVVASREGEQQFWDEVRPQGQ